MIIIFKINSKKILKQINNIKDRDRDLYNSNLFFKKMSNHILNIKNMRLVEVLSDCKIKKVWIKIRKV